MKVYEGCVDGNETNRERIDAEGAIIDLAEGRGPQDAVSDIVGVALWNLAIYSGPGVALAVALDCAQAVREAATQTGHSESVDSLSTAERAELLAQTAVARVIFGLLLFRPVTIDPRWLTSTVICGPHPAAPQACFQVEFIIHAATAASNDFQTHSPLLAGVRLLGNPAQFGFGR